MLELLLDLTRRALEGFVFAAPCVGIWFLGLRFHKKAPPFAHMLAAFGLCLYLSGVLAATGIGKPFGFFCAAGANCCASSSGAPSFAAISSSE